ncbi:MAG: hypothetical protein Hals2KO_08620 [Halioglobus sp.]
MGVCGNSNYLMALVLILLATLQVGQVQAGDPSKAPWIGKQLDGKKCHNPRPPPGGGPYNYLNRPAIDGTLNLVENAHFPASVENLQHGATGSVMADLDFLLLSFPNHHRGLNSSVRYSLKKKGWKNEKHGVPAECYLQRAMKYAPSDSIPFELYGYYMTKKGQPKLALGAYKRALKIRPKDVMLNYNTALLMAKQKQYDDAMKIARPLYDAGLTLPGLRNILVKAGKWKFSEAEIEKIKAAAAKLEQVPSTDEADVGSAAPGTNDGTEKDVSSSMESKTKSSEPAEALTSS